MGKLIKIDFNIKQRIEDSNEDPMENSAEAPAEVRVETPNEDTNEDTAPILKNLQSTVSLQEAKRLCEIEKFLMNNIRENAMNVYEIIEIYENIRDFTPSQLLDLILQASEETLLREFNKYNLIRLALTGKFDAQVMETIFSTISKNRLKSLSEGSGSIRPLYSEGTYTFGQVKRQSTEELCAIVAIATIIEFQRNPAYFNTIYNELRERMVTPSMIVEASFKKITETLKNDH
ncbi:hypothetical protein KJ632_03995 [Patescibacteria group bacterium]|nr:hypothetical protein [Patescibacteria group bacterium]